MQNHKRKPPQHGESITCEGWLESRRDFKSFAFLSLRTGQKTVQCVASNTVLEAVNDAQAGPESVLRVSGTVAQTDKAKAGWELQAEVVEVISAVVAPVPVTLSHPELNANLATVLDHAGVTNRHATRLKPLQVAAQATAAFRETVGRLGFAEVFTPKLVASATEGGSNVFPVEYFGQTAYLAQSPQFYKQMMVGVFGRVFEVGPVFRAEPHATRRHLNTYTSLDVELGFIESHRCVMEVVEEVVWSMVGAVAAWLPESISRVPIPSVTFEEAKEVAGSGTGQLDLSPEEERAIGAWAESEHGSPFVFVTGYPMAKRPFYTAPSPGNSERSNSFDLLFRGTELITGGQRLHRYRDYVEALEARGLGLEPFAEYLEVFRYGMPPHGGFAIGQERFVAQLLGLENVREACAFPRDITRLTP